MSDVWTIGPSAAARALRACGFSPRQAERLVALKLRYQRQVSHDRIAAQRRLLFARWLVEHGCLCDWPENNGSRQASVADAPVKAPPPDRTRTTDASHQLRPHPSER